MVHDATEIVTDIKLQHEASWRGQGLAAFSSDQNSCVQFSTIRQVGQQCVDLGRDHVETGSAFERSV